MHALSLLETWLRRNSHFVHEARVKVLLKVVDGLLRGEKAILTHLGRSLRTTAYEKHNIKCVDRLLGNAHLWSERLAIYQALAAWVLSAVERPWIIVDWSDLEVGHEYLMLRASVPIGGRTITIYEEVHPLKRYNAPPTHRRFLKQLHRVVPAHCTPVIITDAGFRGPWFTAIEAWGWDWIGRVRNVVKYCPRGSETWRTTHSLYYRATRRPTYLGQCWLSKRNPYFCYLHLFKSLDRKPGRPRKRKPFSKGLERERRMARDPWLLATSLSPKQWSANRIMNAYRKRMQIEEAFRDLKSHRWGYGIQYARSRSTQRLENLLFLTTLATVATCLVGLAAKARGWMKHFQANTVTHTPVLSIFFLGRRLLKSYRFKLAANDLIEAMTLLPNIVRETAQHP